MTNYNNEDVRVISYAGTEVPMSEGLDVEAVLEAMGAPGNATRDFNPATGVLEVQSPVGSKGAFDEDEDEVEEIFSYQTSEGYEYVEDEDEDEDDFEDFEDFGPQWALPKHTFSYSEVRFIEDGDYNVEAVGDLIQAKKDYKDLVLPQAHREAQAFIDGDLTAQDLVRKLRVLGLA